MQIINRVIHGAMILLAIAVLVGVSLLKNTSVDQPRPAPTAVMG